MSCRRSYCIASLLTILALSMSTAAAIKVVAASSGKYFDHVVTILMENNDLPSVLSQGQYEAGLANNYTLAKGYSAVSHPSEPNYAALISGQIGVNANDGLCCGQDTHLNLIDNLELHGLTWKAFAEDQTTGDCTGSNIDTDHYPFLFFGDIVNNTSRCNNLAGTTAPSDTELVSMVNEATGWPNWIWLTPNLNDDAHDTSIAYGDNYLSKIVPEILGSKMFQMERSALIILYDEGNDVACSSGGTDCVYASWSGPVARRSFASSSSYTHYSYLHTMDDNWGMGSLTSQEASAPVMSEFFTGSASILNTFQILLIVAAVGLVTSFAIVMRQRGRSRKRHSSTTLTKS